MGYQLFMLVLSVYAVGAAVIRTAMTTSPESVAVLAYVDGLVCALFFADFLYSLWSSSDRRRYFLTWGWLDLISSIPMLDVARWGRVARILRVVRLLRGLRATKILTDALLARRAQNGVLAACLAAILLVAFCSVAMLQVEVAPEANIKTAEDAVWWALSTITTVGYGDRYPVTSEGRAIAMLLMVAGVGLFTTFSGFLAAWFLSPSRRIEAEELSALREEIRQLRAQLCEPLDRGSADP